MPESPPAPNVLRYLPVIVIALVALLGVILLRDELTFDALARHRETLLAFRAPHVWSYTKSIAKSATLRPPSISAP